jgi:hypothetical protein
VGSFKNLLLKNGRKAVIDNMSLIYLSPSFENPYTLCHIIYNKHKALHNENALFYYLHKSSLMQCKLKLIKIMVLGVRWGHKWEKKVLHKPVFPPPKPAGQFQSHLMQIILARREFNFDYT